MICEPLVQEARQEMLSSVTLLEQEHTDLAVRLQAVRTLGGVAWIVGIPWGLPLAKALAAALPQGETTAIRGAPGLLRHHLEGGVALDQTPEGLAPWSEALEKVSSRPVSLPPRSSSREMPAVNL
ncbi:MAG: hypothetical protein RMJ98_19340 [Myxococcales bacterium]|nr:hypothetical protein [Polyangiaceae bacterium]MDW8251455.1 hypothetical protein [Myxococcales bacterium]